MSGYDPEAFGARCRECYLYIRREGDPVPPETRPNALALAIGEGPGSQEVKLGKPFIGDAGNELVKSLAAIGYRRSDLSITNGILCKYPGPASGAYARVMNDLRRENKARKAKALEPLPSPVECCRPRLLREVAQHQNIITLGKVALLALTNGDYSLFDVRGGPLEAEIPGIARRLKILPTLHPSFVLHAQKWRKTLRIDLRRAMRWFTDALEWKDPKVIIRPSVEVLESFLFRWLDPTTGRRPRFYAWDLETDAKEALDARIRCVTFNTAEYGVLVPLMSIDGSTRFYPADDERRIIDIIKRFLIDPSICKVGHNSRVYDTIVVQSRWGITPVNHYDTLPMHRSVESELPHDLAYVGSVNTDVVAWKAEKSGTEAKTDRELHDYCLTDGTVTARIEPPLEEAVRIRDQVAVVKNDMRVLDACVGMHRLGMLVDPVKRDEYDRTLLAEAVRCRRICQEAIGIASFNPGSVPQVQDILFGRWNLPPVELSEITGEPSTGDDVLIEYRVNQPLSADRLRFIDALRRYRRAVKIRGTDVIKYRRVNERLPDDLEWEDVEETEEERKYRLKKDLKKTGILLADGRVHSSWNQLTTSGRLNSSSPNIANKARKYRAMYIPEPDCPFCKEPHVFVAADEDQIELRVAASRWQMKRFIEVFARGGDPHAETAMTVFGAAAKRTLTAAEAWAKAEGKKPKEYPDWKRMRDFSKRFRYGCQYGAEDETVHKVIVSVEDDAGNLVYADVSRTQTAQRRAALLEADPEMAMGWDQEITTFRKQGYLREPVWGRRRDFLNGWSEDTKREVINFPIQSPASAIVHEAMFDATSAIPFGRWCPKTGLVHQGYDSMLLEVPRSQAAWAAGVLKECMTRKVPCFPDMLFTADAKVGATWGDV